jgi:hypothetical protein
MNFNLGVAKAEARGSVGKRGGAVLPAAVVVAAAGVKAEKQGKK